MTANAIKRALLAAAVSAAAMPAYAHVGAGSTASFSSGFMHPLLGLDHFAAMLAVGLWAGLKGGRAVWAWPLAFVGVMLGGAALGMAGLPVPFVEPAILASVVVLGLLVALAVELPIAAGIGVVAIFALFHGHAHGTEVPENADGLGYMFGFALATAALHGIGIVAGLVSGRTYRAVTRAAGAACAVFGAGLALGAF